jgi:transposase
MENSWKTGLQIDRIDNGLGYTPDNCRWVTSAANNRNRRNNKLSVEKVAEIRQLLSEGVSGPKLASQFGVHHSLIYRIKLNQQWLV